MHNRTAYSKADIISFANNIAATKGKGVLGTGILQPIVVRKNANRYERIAGFRRLSAMKLNGESLIPAIILENIDDATARFMRNSENREREQLNPYDELIGELETIALMLNFDSISNVKSILYKIDNASKGKTSLTEEDKEGYRKISELLIKYSKYSIGTLTDRLVLLNLKKIILDEMKENHIGYEEAKILKAVKNDDIIKKLISFIKYSKPSNAELRAKRNEITPNNKKEKQSNFDLAKSSFSSLKKKDYNSLEDEDKEAAEIIFREISEKMKVIQNIFKRREEGV